MGRLRAHYGLADQFRFMERQGTVRVVQVVAERSRSGSASSRHRRCRSRPRTRTRSCSRRGGSASSIAMDETHGWDAARARPARPRRAPDRRLRAPPFSGERLIPEEFCRPPVKKTRYAQALEQRPCARAAAGRALPRRGDGPALPRRARPPRRSATAASRHSTGCCSTPERAPPPPASTTNADRSRLP